MSGRARRGPDAFRDTYGTEHSEGRNAYGKCVSTKAKAKVKREVKEFDNAATECKDERADDPRGIQGDLRERAHGSQRPGYLRVPEGEALRRRGDHLQLTNQPDSTRRAPSRRVMGFE